MNWDDADMRVAQGKIQYNFLSDFRRDDPAIVAPYRVDVSC